METSYDAQPPSPTPVQSPRKNARRGMLLFVLVVGVAIGLVLPFAKSAWQGAASLLHTEAKPAKTSGAAYQAVFLTNGQVYFGSVDDDTADPVVVRDIYYLQVTQQLQPDPNAGGESQQVPQVSLVKLGDELHGPTDEMRITRSHVLFVEDLKDDSDVVKAIEAAKEPQ